MIGKKYLAIPEEKVPSETGLIRQKFRLARPGNPYTSPSKGAWTHKVRLADGSIVTYSWYRFVDQPAFQ
ncbi:MAG: hypothetical protein JRI56_10135 [Deltaproteobacteria bacterium]|nr:hypothetical protein [Deltaproteobacteria bacterium]